MSPDAWVVAAAVVAVALLVPRILRGRKVASEIVKKKLADGAKVVDVRTLDEFRSGAYPGAIHIPVQELPQRMAEVDALVSRDKARPVVVYCGSGHRAAKAKRTLEAAGYSRVVNGGGLDDLQ